MAELSRRLVELVIGTPSHKVLLTELPKLYREKYKEDLDYQGRGFKKLGLLTDAAEGVEREGNFLALVQLDYDIQLQGILSPLGIPMAQSSLPRKEVIDHRNAPVSRAAEFNHHDISVHQYST